MSRNALILSLIVGGTALAGPALAEVRVSGTPQAVRVEAEGASAAEVMQALADRFGLTVRSSVALDRDASGTFTGKLESVAGRVLRGYDHMSARRDNGLEIIVLDQRKGGAMPPVIVQSGAIAPPMAGTPTASGGRPSSPATVAMQAQVAAFAPAAAPVARTASLPAAARSAGSPEVAASLKGALAGLASLQKGLVAK